MKATPPHWIVTREEQGLRLDRFLAAPARLGSRGRVREALDRGKVFVNDEEASAKDAGAPVSAGDVVRLWLDRPGSAKRRTRPRTDGAKGGLPILYEDEALLVVNKPAGLLSVPLGRRKDSASAYSLVTDHLGPRGGGKPLIVHRIDRDTSGIVVFAKTFRAQQAIKDQFARREPERVYLAVVHGRPRPAEGRWRDYLVWDAEALEQKPTDANNPKGVEAIASYRVLDTFAHASLIEVRLHTGKRNQIRLQAALRGHGLVGERQYASGPSERTGPARQPPSGRTGPTHPRQALHALRLAFLHPADGRLMTFEAPMPQDMSELLQRLQSGRRK